MQARLGQARYLQQKLPYQLQARNQCSFEKETYRQVCNRVLVHTITKAIDRTTIILPQKWGVVRPSAKIPSTMVKSLAFRHFIQYFCQLYGDIFSNYISTRTARPENTAIRICCVIQIQHAIKGIHKPSKTQDISHSVPLKKKE